MIGADLIGQIRRAFDEECKGLRTIARELGTSRTTVLKVIRGRGTEFKFERDGQPMPTLGESIGAITTILKKEAKLPKRERRSTQRLFEELRGRGYEGAHDSVHQFARAWCQEHAGVPA